ncbi:hypothetical protein [Blastopirellula marina]|uniref:Zinc-ribbon 15 domain-containing protein n=1 Tax=Blastopirellula marina TaxID=124 RepID=A0A2S8GUJ1_9BACT|nr:hypothetical protein [Blastopirellula marina]PQO47724.1 hypothetical protein C5Y93_03455 [Blastopirellula marina]
MTIIWFGWHSQDEPTDHRGKFHCPTCRRSTTYVECRSSTRYYVWFIPLGSSRPAEAGIRCLECGDKYGYEAITDFQDQLEKWKCPKCDRKWPITNVRCAVCKVRPDGSPG